MKQVLWSGYNGEFAIECPLCGTLIEFYDRTGDDDRVRVECDGACGREYTVSGFDVTVTPVLDSEDR
jgi:hypothetical protein